MPFIPVAHAISKGKVAVASIQIAQKTPVRALSAFGYPKP